MADRMDRLIAAAVRQGFKVWQNGRGVWFFRRGLVTVTAAHTPTEGNEWVTLIGALRGAGLTFPPGD
ncbi:hypothetical protein GCM10017673_38500 [Streptosporangium violaceochromogenes]|nr:hypothetical protein GCM10017673_38500 [Streptosporangium violaceochromogenes]